MPEKRKRYQCFWTGKLYESQEKAATECKDPTQTVIQGVDSHWKKGIFGTVSRSSKKK